MMNIQYVVQALNINVWQEEAWESFLKNSWVPVYLIERMWPDWSVVSCSNENLEGERLPLCVTTQLYRGTVWGMKSNCDEANGSEPQHVSSDVTETTFLKNINIQHVWVSPWRSDDPSAQLWRLLCSPPSHSELCGEDAAAPRYAARTGQTGTAAASRVVAGR